MDDGRQVMTKAHIAYKHQQKKDKNTNNYLLHRKLKIGEYELY
jgi:hypothetical protein